MIAQKACSNLKHFRCCSGSFTHEEQDTCFGNYFSEVSNEIINMLQSGAVFKCLMSKMKSNEIKIYFYSIIIIIIIIIE